MPTDLHIAGAAKASASPQEPYQPIVPGQLTRDSVEVVDGIHRIFLQSMERKLSELLQLPVKMVPRDSEQSTFLNTLKGPQAGERIIALDLSPVPGCGFLSFSRPLLFGVLDILLATPDDSTDDSGRVVTAIELHVLREVFDLIAQTLAEIWKQFCPAAFRQIPLSDVELEQRVAAAGDDPALILNANVELGGVVADLRLVVPTCLPRMAELRFKSDSAGQAQLWPAASGILDRLGGARLEIEAVLQGASIRISDLLDLTPGRILMLGNCDSSSFDFLVNGTNQFKGGLVSENGRYAIQIVRPSGRGLPIRHEGPSPGA
jgi:flagellar motor switch protein FliM